MFKMYTKLTRGEYLMIRQIVTKKEGLSIQKRGQLKYEEAEHWLIKKGYIKLVSRKDKYGRLCYDAYLITTGSAEDLVRNMETLCKKGIIRMDVPERNKVVEV